MHLAFPMPGPTEIMVICGILFVLFGAKRLPGMMRAIGSSGKEFRKGIEEGMSDD